MKLSGAGKDAHTALRDALSLSPLQEHRSERNRGWEASTIFTKETVYTCGCVCMCMCACVNSRCVDIIVLQFLTVVANDAIEASGGLDTRWAPLLPPKPCIQGQGAADWPLMGLLLFNVLRLSV